LGITKIVNTSKDSSPLISFLTSVCMKHNELRHLISPTTIREVALQSFNIEMGILLIENQLMHKNEDSTQAWIELGQLYNAIEMDDIVRSILETKVAQNQFTKQALYEELNSDYNNAHKIYTQALNQWNKGWNAESKPSLQEVSFWKEQRLNCLRKLTRWEELNGLIEAEVCGEGDQKRSIQHVWKMENADTLIPLYMESTLKQPNKWADLQHFISGAFNDPLKREFLEKRFSSELAALSI